METVEPSHKRQKVEKLKVCNCRKLYNSLFCNIHTNNIIHYKNISTNTDHPEPLTFVNDLKTANDAIFDLIHEKIKLENNILEILAEYEHYRNNH